jgi:hypothetical protein
VDLEDLVIKYAQYQIALSNEESKEEIFEDDSASNTGLAIPRRQQSMDSVVSYIENPRQNMYRLIQQNFVYSKIEMTGNINVKKTT